MRTIISKRHFLILYICCVRVSTLKAFIFQSFTFPLVVQPKKPDLRIRYNGLQETRNDNEQQEQRKSKRRFAQQAHDRGHTVAKKSFMTDDRTTTTTKSEYSEERQRKGDEIKDTFSHMPRRSAEKKRSLPLQPASRGLSKSNMIKWNTNLSIEDLEAKLSKRWRTSLTAYDGRSSSSTAVDPRRVVKSKPVLDPWSTKESIRANQNDDSGLQRVKRFQEKFKVGGSSTPGDIEVSLGQDEYYDDDDIEVEDVEDEEDEYIDEKNDNKYAYYDDGVKKKRANERGMQGDGLQDDKWNSIDRLSSSNPASKSSKLDDTKPSVRKDHNMNQANDDSGGFFFRQSSTDVEKSNHDNVKGFDRESVRAQKYPASEHEEIVEGNKGKKGKASKEAHIAPPLLDENGNEQYFTLDLALQQLRRAKDVNPDEAMESSDSVIINNGLEYSTSNMSEGVAKSFKDLGITNETILLNLKSMGCPTPLPVQLASCPPVLDGKDVLISTHTGSGKSIAFLAPLVQKLISRERSLCGGEQTSSQQPQVFIVAPGRELASQLVAVARELLVGTNINVALAIGGTPFQRCYDTIRRKKPSIVVGTPGRIAELIVGREGEKTGKLKLSNCFCFVFDEFDALFQFPVHREPTMAIWNTVSKLHHQKKIQTILCSATAMDFSEEKLSQFLNPDYAHVSVGESAGMMTQGTKTRMSLTTIHAVVHLDHRRFALDTIRKILHTDPTPQQVLIFVNNARRVSIGKNLPDISK